MKKEYDFSKGERGKLFRPEARSEKKRNERWFLEAARTAGPMIPDGEIMEFEGPDFKIETANGTLGIEVTELLRSGKDSIPPVAKESFHREVIRIAEAEYYRRPGATPVNVLAYFWDAEQKVGDKRRTARKLADFVKENYISGGPPVTYERRDMLPKGFHVIAVASPGGPWLSGESGSITLSEINEQLASRIKEKNKLLPSYRAALPNSPIWLLVYSGFAVSRGMPIPAGIEEQPFQFDFDKVLFFAQPCNRAVEIRRAK